VYVAGKLVGRGSYRSDALGAGRYLVRASLGALPGCASADTTAAVDLAPGARRTVSLQPVACGRLLLEFTAANAAHYTLVPVPARGPAREGVLPLAQPLVLPDGTYRLTVQASACATFEDTLPVVAGRVRRAAGRLICE
jgi:hypothetical protein